MLESRHNYEDNADVYTPVRIPGARALIISFDEQTATEANYDFVQFFKDAARQAWWGDEKYSGVGARGNWPGLGGRPPLEIPGDSFLFHFHSDGNDTGWGYRARVRAAAELSSPSSSLRVGGTW